MWRCLVFVVAVTLWNLSALAVPQGENTCHGVVKHPVKVKVNVTEPVTFRTYTWCLRVPPRCSKYIVQMRERVKEQIEMHNRTITVCCRGFVEMEYKCVPACPPMTECPNMHCNRTNHCYCTPGYSGVFCNDPCPKGSWGKDCKKPCDCPDGFTCHHLTGDCMMDDKPTAKTTVRHSRFTHVSSEMVTTQVPSTVTHLPSEKPSQTTPPITTTSISRITTTSPLPLSSSTLMSTMSTHTTLPAPTTDLTTSHPTRFRQPYQPTAQPPLIQISQDIVETTPVPPTVQKEVINDKENVATTLKSQPTLPLMSTTMNTPRHFTWQFVPPETSETYHMPSEKANEEPELITTIKPEITTVPLDTISQVTETILPIKPSESSKKNFHILTTSRPDIVKNNRTPENPLLTVPLFKNDEHQLNDSRQHKDRASEFQIPFITLSNAHPYDKSFFSSKPTTNDYDLKSTTPNKVFFYQKPSSSLENTIPAEVTTEVLSSPFKSEMPSTEIIPGDKIEVFTLPTTFFHSVNLITKPADNPIIPMQTPNRNLNPFIPAPFPTQYHGSLTYPVTVNVPFTDFGLKKDLNKDPIIQESTTFIPVLNSEMTTSVDSNKHYSTHMPKNYFSSKTTEHHIPLDYFKPVRKLSTFFKPAEEAQTSSVLPPFLIPTVSMKPTTVSDVGIFVFPPPKPNKKPVDSSPESIEETIPYFYPTTSLPPKKIPSDFIDSNDDKNYHSNPEPTSPFLTTVPLVLPPDSSYPETKKFRNIQHKEIAGQPNLQVFPFLSPSDIAFKSTEEYQELITNSLITEVPFISAPVTQRNSPFEILRTMISSSGSVKESNKTKAIDVDHLELTTTKSVSKEHIVDSVFNVLSKNDFIAIFRPDSELKRNMNFIPATTPAKESAIGNSDTLNSNSIMASTYSFSNKTVTPSDVSELNASVLLDNIDTNKVSTNPSDLHHSSSNVNVLLTTPIAPPAGENHNMVNGKLLEEPSNYLPTVLDQVITTVNNQGHTHQQSTNSFVATDAPRSDYLPSDKDFLNLTYILNSINDFTSSNKRGMKQSPKLFIYSNPNKDKLTEKPFVDDLNTNTVYDSGRSTETEKSFSAPPQVKKSKSHGSLHNKGKNIVNDSKIIHLNISSHLSFHNTPTTKVTRKLTPVTQRQTSQAPLYYRTPDLYTKAIDGRITTVSILSSSPVFKFPTKRSAKDTNFLKTEKAFILSQNPSIKSNQPTESLHAASSSSSSSTHYNPSKVTPSLGSYPSSSIQDSDGVGDEVTKKPFRRKADTPLQDEMRPNMTAALAAHSALPEEKPDMSLTTGILAAATCVLLVGSFISVSTLLYVYCRKEKPVPMESCIMAYEPTQIVDLPTLYSTLKIAEKIHCTVQSETSSHTYI